MLFKIQPSGQINQLLTSEEDNQQKQFHDLMTFFNWIPSVIIAIEKNNSVTNKFVFSYL